VTEPDAPAATKSPSSELELGAIVSRLDPAPGFAIRLLHLRNR